MLKKIKLIIIITFILNLFLYTSQTLSLSKMDLSEIKQGVNKFLLPEIPKPYKNLKVTISGLAKNILLPRCEQVQYNMDSQFNRYAFGHQKIVVTCDNPYWKIYLEARIQADIPVVFTKQIVYKEDQFTENNVNIRYVDSDHINRDHFAKLSEVIGLISKIYIPAHVKILPSMLMRKYVIKKNGYVDIVMQERNLYIRMQGIALENGRLGDTIRVKNTRSEKTVLARVINEQRVLVN